MYFLSKCYAQGMTCVATKDRKFWWLITLMILAFIAFTSLRFWKISSFEMPMQFFLNFSSMGNASLEGDVTQTFLLSETDDEQKEYQWESLKGTRITVQEIQENFERLINVTSKENKECIKVHQNSSSYWRSVDKANKSHGYDMYRIGMALGCGAFNHEDFMSVSPRDPPLPWELDYLSQPPMRDIRQTVFANLSTVTLVNTSQNSTFLLGDTLQFQITLYDGRGQRRSLGGDSVHLSLQTKGKKASIAADVVDNKDGSYLATVVAPWVGDVTVVALVDYTREIYRATMFVQRVFKTVHWLIGKFASDIATEASPCSPLPAIPGYPSDEICNLTEANGGFPWYCGKPVKKDLLNCSHFVTVRRTSFWSVFPLTEAEEELIKMAERKRPFLIPNDIVIKVQKDPKTNLTTLSRSTMNCSEFNLSDTLSLSNSFGYFYESKWRSLDCQLPEVNKEFLHNCLNDTQVLILGDSNSRRQMDSFTRMTGCRDQINRTKVTWHAPLFCNIDSINVSIKYFPPKHPFYGSPNEDLTHSVLFSSLEKMEAIPEDGKYIVHLHNFMHLVPFHLAAMEQRLRLIRQAVERLLARKSDVIVMYQSAHAAYGMTNRVQHKTDAFIMELQRSILQGLGDRFMFIYTWPMTIAAVNYDDHPTIGDTFLPLYMGYVCGRL